MEEARIFRSMPLVHRAFKQLADHVSKLQLMGRLAWKICGFEMPNIITSNVDDPQFLFSCYQHQNQEPPMHFEQHELHGNLMKGFLHGILTAFCQDLRLLHLQLLWRVTGFRWIHCISKWTPTIWQFIIRLRLLSHAVLAVCRDCRVARDSECSIWNSGSAEHRIPPVASARSKF